MTASAPPPAAGAGHRAAPAVGPRAAAALALAALSGAGVVHYLRVFSGTEWLPRALLAAWLPIGLLLALRGAGLRRWMASAITLAAGVVYLIVAIPGPLPTGPAAGGPVTYAVRSIAAALATIDATFTPAPPSPGLLGLLIAAAWAGGVVGAATLGERLPLAPAPSIVMFVFAAAVGSGAHHVAFVAPFLASLLVLLYVETWLRGGQPRPTGVRAASASAAGVLVLALSAPTLSAGYLRGGPRIGTNLSDTTVISPIVQILPRLNDRTPRTMFTVEASRASYWKLGALDRFDGNAWSATGEYRPTSGAVDLDDAPKGRVSRLRQTFRMDSLGGIWVPAAYAPTRVTGIEVTVDPVRGTVATDRLDRGETYSVVSDIPQPTPEVLRLSGIRGAPAGSTDLPLGLPSVITQMAHDLTASGAPTAYDKALAIQSFLRTFEYSQDVAVGHSGNYLVRFLTQVRAGYCEQFAGAMAVMLRALGIPARVAVGFLPGRPAGNGFVVSNEEAHAWPEVWFRDIGWVGFEPTPRSGLAPPSYPAGTTRGRPAPSESSSAATASPSPAASSASASPSAATPKPPASTAPPAGGTPLPAWIARTTAAVLTLGVAALLLMAARAARLRAWTVLGRSPAQRVAGAWQELLLRGADAWRPRRRAETEQEYARAMASTLGIDYSLLEPLLASRQRTAYAASPPGEGEARGAVASMGRLRRSLFLNAGGMARVRLLFSPRPLVTRRTA